MLRVIGGSAKGRKLQGPPERKPVVAPARMRPTGRSRPAPAARTRTRTEILAETRPTSDLIRGVIFDMLDAMEADYDRVLDLYAGTGALGIEALSRGDGQADFVERELGAINIIQQNLRTCSFADWADAVAWANVGARPSSFGREMQSTKDLAASTPIDQYIAIREGFSFNGSPFSNAVYLTDMFEPNLTEVGRLGYIEECINSTSPDPDSAVKYAICQGDLEAFDLTKFHAQLRTDTAHKGEHKMALRLIAYELPARLKEHAANVAKIYAKDEAYKKLWDAAKKGRADWAALFGGNKELLSLAQRMDTYHFSKSRKAFDGCAETTTAALHAAITAKVPAKLFKGKKDIRRDPYEGVAKAVGPAMLDIPEIAFVAGPYIICHNDTGAAEFLSYYIDNVPGQRGPRAGAFTEITKAKIVLDDMSASISYSTSWNHPFGRSHGSLASTGAVVKSVKLVDDALIVTSEAIPMKRDECLQSRRTNRISRINSDGSLSYETICDKWGVVTYNDSWGDFKILKSYQKVLKKGVLFSSVGGANGKAADILALWPKKDAKLPTMVLGAPVK